MSFSSNITKKARVIDQYYDDKYASRIGTIINYDDEDGDYVFYKLTFDKMFLYDEWFHSGEIKIID